MFKEFKTELKRVFAEMIKDVKYLYHTEYEREMIWWQYIESFDDPVEKQEHDCNCCKSFLRQFGSIVTIKDNKVHSIWDVELDKIPEVYHKAVLALREYVNTAKIKDVFFHENRVAGTASNYSMKHDVIFEHFSLNLPACAVEHKSVIPTKKGGLRDSVGTFKRALEELDINSIETVLDLTAQGSLYRSDVYERQMKAFHEHQLAYNQLSNEREKELYCWLHGVTDASVSRIRNTAIGTMLVNLSEGMSMDQAEAKYNRFVDPSRYQRRETEKINKRQLEEAKNKIKELGMMESLERRFAYSSDLNINDSLFVDRSSELMDIFDEMSKDLKVDPKKYSKVEEISIEKFIDKVLPTAKSIEVLLENKHLGNMVSLITGVNKDAPSMFKWNNPFSWAYTGGVADSIKERVKAAGGNVDAVLRVSLAWSNYTDLDLHVIEPNGNKIWFNSTRSSTSGFLDTDANGGGASTREPVENITWTNSSKMKSGEYKVVVHNYSMRDKGFQEGFTVQIECDGKTYEYSFDSNPGDQQYKDIITFNWSKSKGLVINGTPTQAKAVNKEKWGLTTNSFVKVRSFALSPNQWEKEGPNKHYMFFLEDCVNDDENVYPFFNEFLKPELKKISRVTELMGSKLKVHQAEGQLSGLGFSSTKQDNSDLIVKVKGSFERVLKIKF